MKLIYITTHYPIYLKQFYNQHLELQTSNYDQQHKALINDCFGWADFWNHALKKLGYEVKEIIGNAEYMQKQWAKENHITYSKKSWLTDIIKAQTKQFKPDIVFVDDYTTYTKDFLTYLRHDCPSIRLILGWCGAPYQDENVFKSYDIVLSNIPSFVNYFQEQGYRSEYMRHAFDPRILEKIDNTSNLSISFSFIGSISKGKDFHHQRENLLKQLLKSTNIQIFADTPQPSFKEKISLAIKQNMYFFVKSLKKDSNLASFLSQIPKIKSFVQMENSPNLSRYVDAEIASRANPPVFGLSMYQKLYESRITFNNHINIASQYASNIRLYEATGIGTCLLTDWQPNLYEVFEPDREVVTYNSIEEATEKVNYLLSHEGERKAIAKAGQKRTLKDHTFDQRAIQLNEIIQSFV